MLRHLSFAIHHSRGTDVRGDAARSESVRVELTSQQQEALKELGYDGAADVVQQDLEDRIVPGIRLQ